MKALTLTQPWATLVALGAKKFETRGWRTHYTGWLAIHASKRWPRWAKDVCVEKPFYDALAAAGYINAYAQIQGSAFPLGAIVVVVNLIDTTPTDAYGRSNRLYHLSDNEYYFGDWTSGRWAWALEDFHRLLDPIPCTGRLGLWDVPAEISTKLLALVEGRS